MDRLSDYDYHLPEDLIAQTPLEDRAASRLLVIRRDTGAIEHHMFRETPTLLQPGDLLVMNDTRVSAVRLYGVKRSAGAVEALVMQEIEPGLFRALLKPGKRLKLGTEIEFAGRLAARVEADLGDGVKSLRFLEGAAAKARIMELGSTPLPPYIHRDLEDRERYQTVYSRREGSAAAPTAGLHFDAEILERIRERGIHVAMVSLDVGIDTFRPIQTDDLDRHVMHGERYEIPEETAKMIAECRGRVIADGTTTVRTLETAATGRRIVTSGSGNSTLFIRPGYQFRVVDAMFTNFHLPKTTMLAMLSALVGRETLFGAYRAAVREKYRFLSFGDSMLVV